MEPRAWGRLRETVYSAGVADPARPAAMFDFDSTLRPYRGRGPSESLTLCFLAGLSASFNIIIVSNRSANTVAALAPIKSYVAALDGAGAGRVTVYASARDRDRKPHTGTWEHYVSVVCASVRPRFAFFCGDAAGRPGDHSAADYAYALNIGARFTTPEALFYTADAWTDPASYGCSAPIPPELEWCAAGPVDLSSVSSPRAIIMIGSPASGKSFLAARLASESSSLLVSNDLQGPRHKAIFNAALGAGRDIIIDNTSPRKADRAHYAARAKARGYAVALFHLTTPKITCFHLNAARCQLDKTGRTKELPPVVIHTYWKRLEPPSHEEAGALGALLITTPSRVSPQAPPEVVTSRYPLA
jgi:predicted kinase